MLEDYYKVLGLKRGASLKEISAAYRSQALIYHPDKRKSSSNDRELDDEVFHKIKTAYQALQDPKIRAELDLQLLGQEERIKRDAQMSEQRKKLRDDLLNREREAKKRPEPTEVEPTEPVKKPRRTFPNESACLLLKCKFPANVESKLALEMIKSNLGPALIELHDYGVSEYVAEFKEPQDAFKTLCKLPNDLIIKANWLTGYPPENLIISTGKNTENSDKSKQSTSKSAEEGKVKYSKDLESSVLERLKLKKQQKQQEQLEKN